MSHVVDMGRIEGRRGKRGKKTKKLRNPNDEKHNDAPVESMKGVSKTFLRWMSSIKPRASKKEKAAAELAKKKKESAASKAKTQSEEKKVVESVTEPPRKVQCLLLLPLEALNMLSLETKSQCLLQSARV